MMNNGLPLDASAWLQEAIAAGVPVRPLLLRLLTADDTESLLALQSAADRIRRQTVGDQVQVRGIIEFSNHCRRNCIYCGINCHNQRLPRYRLTPETIFETAEAAADLGIDTIILQSGEDPYYTADLLAGIVRAVKQLGVAVTLSVGERPPNEYALWRKAGADRYLLKFETSRPELYARLHPGFTLAQRLLSLDQLAALGYQVGSGTMIGLPGQTAPDLVDDLLLMQHKQLAMLGIGPFLPHPDTPLGNVPSGSITTCLRVIALARLLLPTAHIPATTALAAGAGDARPAALAGGANVLMVTITPREYRQLYAIYPNRQRALPAPQELRQAVEQLARRAARLPTSEEERRES